MRFITLRFRVQLLVVLNSASIYGSANLSSTSIYGSTKLSSASIYGSTTIDYQWVLNKTRYYQVMIDY